MFPTSFSNDAKIQITNHRGIMFNSDFSYDTVLSRLNKPDGINSFLKRDDTGSNVYGPLYKDNRINGNYTAYTAAGCCAFTKNHTMWYLYPIHEEELTNVGLDEQDLIKWINYLNNLKVGFKYLYLGEQSIGIAQANFMDRYSLRPTNKFYWVAKAPEGTINDNINPNIPYLHWIMLRYLFNGQVTPEQHNLLKPKLKLAYYNIPRITMYFHEKLGLSALKSLLYALVTSNYYSGYGIAYTDYMGQKGISKTQYGDGQVARDYTAQQAPCLRFTREQFKQVWHNRCTTGNMNSMLTQRNFTGENAKIKGLKDMEAPYVKDIHALYDLFAEGKYVEFVKAIDKSYGVRTKFKIAEEVKKEVVEEVVKPIKKRRVNAKKEGVSI
jgi:hypothetical protein